MSIPKAGKVIYTVLSTPAPAAAVIFISKLIAALSPTLHTGVSS